MKKRLIIIAISLVLSFSFVYASGTAEQGTVSNNAGNAAEEIHAPDLETLEGTNAKPIDESVLACLAAKRMGVRKTVALVENFDYIDMAESLDIGTIINKKAIAAGHIYKMLFDTNVENVRFIMAANADVAEFVVQKGAKVTKKKVFELGLPNGATLGGLVRDGEGILISGGTQIKEGDIVVAFCHNVDMKRIDKFFE